MTNETPARPRYVRIAVKDKSEGEALKTALDDPMTRAFVQIVGTLLPFSTRTRKRVLDFVADSLNDHEGPLRARISEHEDAPRLTDGAA